MSNQSLTHICPKCGTTMTGPRTKDGWICCGKAMVREMSQNSTFTFPMPPEIAGRIKFLRTESPVHSYRRLGEVIASEYPAYTRQHLGEPEQDGGNQLYGIQLCQHAAETLGEHDAEWK